MAIYSIAYDLFQPQEYQAFYECLEAFPHVHVMDSLWLVQANEEAGALRDRLMPLISGGDALFVSRVSQDWAGAGTQCGEWLNAPERHQALASRSTSA
ncbi:hypothetical protein [Modicisalibacter xianhensis]|uniref:SinR-like protein n=1 Tax=Modicisalibacter xianhensis TaxID=442341 RepID=A0A1I3DIT5_9GAMM|nr:hypothetical protein [Halomonas xianhensis]SFH86682.1 hypothetical protein SAMN04487959_11154 [Halomonas xianhensis]